MICSATGTEPPGELQVPSPPEPESAREAVPDAGLQAGHLGRIRPRRDTSAHPWPGTRHRADHEERTHAPCQRQQQPQQPCYPAYDGQS